MAAAQALAELARKDVPPCVARAYDGATLSFGHDYIIPKPFDPRVLLWVSPAVAQAAMETGVARKTVDIKAYRAELAERIKPDAFGCADGKSCLTCRFFGLQDAAPACACGG